MLADPAFKQRLLTDGTAAIVEMGCPKIEANNLVVVENTPLRHNVVVWQRLITLT